MTKTFFVFILTITLVCGYCRTAQAQTASKDETAGKARKKVLFLAGGRSHRTGEHEHRAGCIILANALNKSGLGFQTEVVSKWPKDMSSFDGVDAVVVYADAGGRYKEDQLKLLDEKVKAGMGIMFIHYGVHPSKKVGEKYFMPWIGGFFQTGISVNPHWTADLTPKKDHPVGRGIQEPFTVNDEFYLNIRFPNKDECTDCYPLTQAKFSPERVNIYNNLWNEKGDGRFGSMVTLMWCRDAKDSGRGIGFTGGHFHRNWAVDDFRKMVLNGIVWIARGEVPETGVVSEKITQEQLNANLDGKLKTPLKAPVLSQIKALEPMPRPEDPKNYNQKKHYELVRKLKAQKNRSEKK